MLLYNKILSYLKDHQLSEIIRGSAIAFIMKGIGAVFGFILNVYVARILGVDNTGVFFLAITIIFVAATLGRFGLDNVSIRKISSFASEDNWPGIKNVFRGSLAISVLITIIISIFFYFFSEWISIFIFNKPELSSPIRWLSIRIVPVAVMTLVAESLKGLKLIACSQLLFNVGLPFLSILVLILFPASHTMDGLIFTWNLTAILIMVIAIIVWYRILKPYPAPDIKPDYSSLIRAGYPFFLIMALNLVITWSSTIFLGVYSNNADVGIFNAAVRTANLMNFLLVSVNTIAAPKFAELYHREQMTLLKTTAQNTTRLMFWLSLPVFLVTLISSTSIMGLFGDQFKSGGVILMILITSQFVNVSTGSVGYLLMMSGNEKMLRNNIFGIAVLNIMLNIFLVPYFGIYGAVIASGTSLVLQNIVSMIMVRIKLQFWTIAIFERKRTIGI